MPDFFLPPGIRILILQRQKENLRGFRTQREINMEKETRYELIDISQEVLSCGVYPGDPRPELVPVLRMESGSLYNLSKLSMCVHNGTHVDAPFHFLAD